MKHNLIESIYRRILREASIDAARAGAQSLDDIWRKISKKERGDIINTLYPPRSHLKDEELETLGKTHKYAEDAVWRQVVIPFKEKTGALYGSLSSSLSVKNPGKILLDSLRYYERYLTDLKGKVDDEAFRDMRDVRDALRDFLTSDPATYMASLLKQVEEIRAQEADTSTREFSRTSREHTPEAPIKSPLGGWAFATKRKGVPPEPDTKTEEKLYAALARHITLNAGLSQWAVGQIKKCLEAGWYTPVFKKPSVPRVYRGTVADERFIRRVAGIPEGQPIPVTGEAETSEILPVRPPRSSTTSWTPSFKVAEGFANRSKEDGVYRSSSKSYSVVLTAETSENDGDLVEVTSELYSAVDAGFEHEAEILGLGPVKMSRINWQRGRMYDE